MQVKQAQNIKTPWQKTVVANGHKGRVNGGITAFIEKSVENKVKNLKCSTLEYEIIASNQRQEKKEVKGEGGQ